MRRLVAVGLNASDRTASISELSLKRVGEHPYELDTIAMERKFDSQNSRKFGSRVPPRTDLRQIEGGTKVGEVVCRWMTKGQLGRPAGQSFFQKGRQTLASFVTSTSFEVATKHTFWSLIRTEREKPVHQDFGLPDRLGATG